MKYYAYHKKKYCINKPIEKKPKTSFSYNDLQVISYNKFKDLFSHK